MSKNMLQLLLERKLHNHAAKWKRLFVKEEMTIDLSEDQPPSAAPPKVAATPAKLPVSSPMTPPPKPEAALQFV